MKIEKLNGVRNVYLLDGVIVAGNYTVEKLFELSDEIKNITPIQSGTIEIGAFVVLRHLNTYFAEKLCTIKIGELIKVVDETKIYVVKKISENFIVTDVVG